MSTDMQKNEAEYAGFVDQGTKVVLEEAVKKIVENFAQTDALEDILSYLEEMRGSLQKTDEQIKEIHQKEKQITDKISMSETSVRTLLQRIQEMEVSVLRCTEEIAKVSGQINKVVGFFEQPPTKRATSRLLKDGEIAKPSLKHRLLEKAFVQKIIGFVQKIGDKIKKKKATQSEQSASEEQSSSEKQSASEKASELLAKVSTEAIKETSVKTPKEASAESPKETQT